MARDPVPLIAKPSGSVNRLGESLPRGRPRGSFAGLLRARSEGHSRRWFQEMGGAAVLLIAIGAATWGPARAEERVILQSRQVLDVMAVRIEGEFATLDFGNGNELRLPAATIREIRKIRSEEPAVPRASSTFADAPWYSRFQPFESLITDSASRHGVDVELVASIVRQESGFDPLAVSPKGAQGLMQLMPATAAELAVENPFDPAQNIDGGVRWLKKLLDRYGGDLDLALAAYNAGEGAVERYGGIPPFRETENYVRQVRATYDALRRRESSGGA